MPIKNRNNKFIINKFHTIHSNAERGSKIGKQVKRNFRWRDYIHALLHATDEQEIICKAW